jgi:hypothetical protein
MSFAAAAPVATERTQGVMASVKRGVRNLPSASSRPHSRQASSCIEADDNADIARGADKDPGSRPGLDETPEGRRQSPRSSLARGAKSRRTSGQPHKLESSAQSVKTENAHTSSKQSVDPSSDFGSALRGETVDTVEKNRSVALAVDLSVAAAKLGEARKVALSAIEGQPSGPRVPKSESEARSPALSSAK